MPEGTINEVKYLLPIVDGKVEGYYDVKEINISFIRKKQIPVMGILIGDYHSFGRIYRKGIVSKMTNQIWTPEKLKKYVFDKTDSESSVNTQSIQ